VATYETEKFRKALLAKGFVEDTTHHHMYWYCLDGKKTSVRTRTSHGEKQFDDSLLSMRRKQLGNLSKEQMIDFIECPFTAEQLRQHLLEKEIVIPRDPNASVQERRKRRQ
jgi:predicted HD phosphohydrolase